MARNQDHFAADGARWFVIHDGEGRPAWNMAFDEALLQGCQDVGHPILRFYAWSVPAATFGYFQKYGDVAAVTRLRPLIRRPTGGGLVPHENDWTYSLAIPAGHEWHRIRAEESYRRVHEWVAEALRVAGENARLAECCESAGPGQCFVGAEKHDVLVDGRKVAGAAQRRNARGLLIQGSIQAARLAIPRSSWESAMTAATLCSLRVAEVDALLQLDSIKTAARELEETRYARDGHNRRR